MKNIIKIIFVFMVYNTISAQEITYLKDFYTDPPRDPDIGVIKYYKDINEYFTPFIGNWKYTNGNKTFIVTLWKETQVPYPSADSPLQYVDEIRGHYKMVQDYGLNSQTTIYTSQINIAQSITPWPYIIFAKSIKNNELGGLINDINTEINSTKYMPLEGFLSIDINPGTSPLTAQWKVDLPEGIRGSDQTITFIIPTNITLTKF